MVVTALQHLYPFRARTISEIDMCIHLYARRRFFSTIPDIYHYKP